MSKLVEMIEALQAKWRTSGDMLEARAYGRCVNALAPILAAAREQEQELAAMKEPMECGHPKAFQVLRMKPDCERAGHSVHICGFPTCSLCADLRAITEMAIAETGNFADAFERWEAEASAYDGIESMPTLPTADLIVREFREKKAEVKAQ